MNDLNGTWDVGTLGRGDRKQWPNNMLLCNLLS